MHAGTKLREWVDYDPLWLATGCLLLGAIILWYGFVFYSINGHRVDTLTLRDLEKTRYKTLAAAIKQFYIPEFTAVEQGSVAKAAALARKTVAAWN